jgi:hypothetical protein
MIMDAELRFSNAQAITASAASTNQLDLKAVRDIGVGEDLYFVAIVDVAFTDASSDSTVVVTLETDNDSAFGSPTLAVQTIGTFAALSAIGTRLVAKLQPLAIVERYLRAYYTVAGGSLTTGSISSFIVLDADLFRAYASNQPILG